MREAYQRWGAALAEDKAVEQRERGATLGGEIHGRLGTVSPSSKRVAELLLRFGPSAAEVFRGRLPALSEVSGSLLFSSGGPV